MHLSNTRLNFISFESLLKGICNRHQQSTRMKVHKKPCHTVFGLNVAGRLVSQCILCQTNRRPSPNQSKTGHLCIFRDFSFSSTLFLKVHKISHSMVKWVFFYYRKHPNTSLHLFVIDFTIWDRLRTFRNMFFEKMWFCHLFSKYDIFKRSLNNLNYYYLIFL